MFIVCAQGSSDFVQPGMPPSLRSWLSHLSTNRSRCPPDARGQCVFPKRFDFCFFFLIEPKHHSAKPSENIRKRVACSKVTAHLKTSYMRRSITFQLFKNVKQLKFDHLPLLDAKGLDLTVIKANNSNNPTVPLKKWLPTKSRLNIKHYPKQIPQPFAPFVCTPVSW